MFEIENLCVEVEGKKIIKNISLKLEQGKIYALMGANGSGKSTLAQTIMGSPKYEIKSGEIIFNKKQINELRPDERAKLGIFLSFQYPQEISGVTIYNFLKQALSSLKKEKGENKISSAEFKELLEKKAEKLDIKKEFLQRYLNESFSGGEKKKTEILQMSVLNPKLAILDETDSGLDIDSIKIVADGVKNFLKSKNKTVLIITHYKRILEYLKPDKIFVMLNGEIVAQGGKELINKLEKKGYKGLKKINTYNNR